MFYAFPGFNLIAPHKQEERLRGTCFRGEKKAGCFIHWRSVEDVVMDSQVRGQLEEEIDDILGSPEFRYGDYSFTLELDKWVGWDSTVDASEVVGLMTEVRPLNKKATAVFVADPRFKARVTKLLTIIVNIRKDAENPRDITVLLVSMYPGPDVGPLKGNVSSREGRVFLDWEQKGQSIPRTNPEETVPLGDCFTWAYQAQREKGGLLVHGYLTHPWDKKLFPHAWLELDGYVHDYQTSQKGDPPRLIASFYRIWTPTRIKTYRSEDSAIALIRNRHYGPWH